MVPDPKRTHMVPDPSRPAEPPSRFRSSEVVPDPGNHSGTTGAVGGSPGPPPYGRTLGTAPAPDPCRAGPEGRVILGRHAPTCPDPESCNGCQPCTSAHCPLCRHRHAQHACPSCLADTRDDLHQIGELVEELPAQAINGRQAFHHHHGVPGGDATVMLTPAAPSRPAGDTRPVYAEPGDPRPPLDVLTYWANRWAELDGPRTPYPPTMARLQAHLDRQLHHIAATAHFPPMARDLSRLRASLENVLHAGDRPELSRVPCLICGARLVKVWGAEEKQDHWRCPSCRELYDQGRYERAKHDQLASRGAERFVPVSDAIAVTGRPEQTVRAWMRQGMVAVRRDQAGRLQVWWPHIREKHRTTPTRRRSR